MNHCNNAAFLDVYRLSGSMTRFGSMVDGKTWEKRMLVDLLAHRRERGQHGQPQSWLMRSNSRAWMGNF